MLSIRFTRVGKKKQPTYRIIVTEKTRDPWGKHVEILGNYNPRTKEAQLQAEKILGWIKKGAQATATVHNLLVNQGIIKADKVRAGKTQPGKKRAAELDKAKADEAAKVAAEKEAAAQAEAPVVEAATEETPAAEAPVEAEVAAVPEGETPANS
ncbi:MAG: 30S ribosomal protein S16 [Candidatus Buchananbacteria bacterium]|nr:30S ribosomal protein S16 [Candidatus Buchananbacteria bacterium]